MDLDQLLKDQLKTLPSALRQIIAEGNWAKATDSVADLYYLDVDQKENLGTEVMLVVVGVNNPLELARNIVDHVGLAEDLAEEIAGSVSRQVLAPIIDLLNQNQTADSEVLPDTNRAAVEAKMAALSQSGRFKLEELMDRFDGLPKEVKRVVASTELAQALSPMALKYDLHVDQAGKLAEVTILIMLGLVPASNFVSEIERRVGVTKLKAGDIAYEVDQKLFRSLRESLKNFTASPEPMAPAIIQPHPANAHGPITASEAATNNIIHPGTDPYRELPQ